MKFSEKLHEFASEMSNGDQTSAKLSMLTLISLLACLAFAMCGCSGKAGSFNRTSEEIVSDLNGKFAQVGPQLWWFDGTQNIKVTSILTKKADGDKVIVAANLEAVADVLAEQPQDNGVKEQPAVTPGGKDKQIPKEKPKTSLPSKVKLVGVAKLYYEQLGDRWFLISVENVSMQVQETK